MAKEFVNDLRSIASKLEKLSGNRQLGREVEFAFNSLSWKILKEIRKPENSGGWPIDTKTSYRKWGFRRIKNSTNNTISFEIFNDATRAEAYKAKYGKSYKSTGGSESYVPFVYAKGDGSKRTPIAPIIIKRAIMEVEPSIEKVFFARLERFLLGKG